MNNIYELPQDNVYPTSVATAVTSGIACLLGIPPLIWHGKHRNLAAAYLIAIIMVNNLIIFVNAIIWHNDKISTWWLGLGYCDVVIKLVMATSTAVPSAVLCILKQLADVMNTDRMPVNATQAQQRRTTIYGILLLVGIPCLTMLLHFITQSSRYFITGIGGCSATMSATWTSSVFIVLPPLLLALVDAWFAGISLHSSFYIYLTLILLTTVLILYRLRNYRTRFDSMLQSSGTTKSRFVRLFVLSLTFVFVLFPIQLFLLIFNWPVSFNQFRWSEVHNPAIWNMIIFIPALNSVSPDRWLRIASGFWVFAFFGLGKDATAMYREWLCQVGLEKSMNYFCNLTKPLLANRKIQRSGRSATDLPLHSQSFKSTETGLVYTFLY